MGERGKSGIYAISCAANGKQYVGQAVSLGDRWLTHRSHLNRGRHANRHLQSAWNKHGADAFEFVVLAYVAAEKEALAQAEQWWVDKFAPEFNLAPVAGSSLGLKHPPRSDEFRKRMGDMKRGFKHRPETIERLRSIAVAQDYHPTPEHIEKLRIANTGRRPSQESIDKGRIKMIGRKQSAQEIANRAASLKGHKVSDEARRKIGAANRERLLGKKQTAEHIEKRTAPLRGRPRPQHLIDAMHGALADARRPKIEKIVAALRADKSLNVTHLAALLGCGRATIRKYRSILQAEAQ